MRNKVNWKILKKSFYIYFAIAPMFCFVLDLYLSTIQPNAQNGEMVVNFDFSLINQVIYFSLWTTIATSIFGILNWIQTDWKNMSFWVNGKNNANLIVTCNICCCLVYVITLLTTCLGQGSIVGFNTWYKILKSTFEHMITPALTVIFFFMFERKKIKTINYIKKYSWWNWSLGVPYLAFTFLRAFMLGNYYPANIFYEKTLDVNDNIVYVPQEPFTKYPYDQLNPDSMGWGIVICLVLLAIAILWGTGILLNYLANLGSEKNLDMIFQIEVNGKKFHKSSDLINKNKKK